jgi:hypothetical protein
MILSSGSKSKSSIHSEASTKYRLCLLLASRLLFDPEEGGCTFFRNVPEFLLDYTALHSRSSTLHSHRSENFESNKLRVIYRSRDSAVGTATAYGLDDRGVGNRVPVGSRIFSTSSGPAMGPTQPPIQWVPGALSLGVKRQGREADHSPPTSVEVRKMWFYTSTPPYAFMA